MMRLALVILMQVVICSSLAQTKLQDFQVTMDVRDISFESLIEKLRKEHHINIVYGVDRLQPSEQLISIKAVRMGLPELMAIICHHYHLSVDFLSNYVLLSPGVRKQPVTNTPTLKSSPKTLLEEPTLSIRDTLQEVSKQDIEVLTVIKDQKDSVVFIEVKEQKPKDSLVTVEALPVKTKRKAHHFIAGVLSVDKNDYHFKALSDPNQEYRSRESFSYSLSYSRSIRKKFRIGMGAMYSSKEFSYNRNFKILIIDDPVSIPNTTTLSYHYLEVAIEAGFQLWKSRTASLSLLSGFNSAFLTSKKETTEYLTHGDPNTNYFIESSNSFLFGALAGVRFSMKLYNRLSLFCEPRYIQYFETVNSSVMHSGTGLFRINVGIAVQLDPPH